MVRQLKRLGLLSLMVGVELLNCTRRQFWQLTEFCNTVLLKALPSPSSSGNVVASAVVVVHSRHSLLLGAGRTPRFRGGFMSRLCSAGKVQAFRIYLIWKSQVDALLESSWKALHRWIAMWRWGRPTVAPRYQGSCSFIDSWDLV